MFILKKEEFTKTSLHNHFGGTGADYKIDSIGGHSFDVNYAKQMIDRAEEKDYQLLAMTNSNHLWISEYNMLTNYINNKGYEMALIPGVELNIVNDYSLSNEDRKYLHLIVLIDPKSDLETFCTKLNQYINLNNENSINIEQLIELVIDYKTILIPHGKKQEGRKGKGGITNSATFNDILCVKDFIPIMIEDNTQSQRKTFEIKIKSMLSEDNYEWLTERAASISSLDRMKDFSNITEPTYIWGEPSFDALFYSTIIGNDRIYREADIIEKSRYIKKIIIKNDGGVLNDSEIIFSHGLNSIIGNSGSGKTLLLNLIKNKLTGENLQNAVSSSSSDYADMYKESIIEIYDNQGNLINIDDFNVFEGENLYRQIVSSINNNKDEILKSLNAVPTYYETRKIINNFNIQLNMYITQRIKISNIMEKIDESLTKMIASVEYLKTNKQEEDNVEYIINPSIYTRRKDIISLMGETKNDLIKAKNIYSDLNIILSKYKIDKDKFPMNDLFVELFKNITTKFYEENKNRINNEAKINYSQKISEVVNEYNSIVGERAKVALESKQILNNEAENIVNLLKEKIELEDSLIVPTLDADKIKNSIYVNSDIIKLENISIYKNFEYDDLTLFFDNVIGNGREKLNKTLFSYYKTNSLNLFDKDSVEQFANIFIEQKYTNDSIFRFVSDKFISFKIMIKDLENSYKDIETLSAGQLSKIYINILIDTKLKAMENNAIILYDQPDNNLEKRFILEILGKKLNELKKKYQVIITTHEPLLVINSDSNSIILATNDPVNGKNSISFENLSMYDVGNKEAAVDKVASLIDGSRKAIRLRNQIYGGLNV